MISVELSALAMKSDGTPSKVDRVWPNQYKLLPYPWSRVDSFEESGDSRHVYGLKAIFTSEHFVRREDAFLALGLDISKFSKLGRHLHPSCLDSVYVDQDLQQRRFADYQTGYLAPKINERTNYGSSSLMLYPLENYGFELIRRGITQFIDTVEIEGVLEGMEEVEKFVNKYREELLSAQLHTRNSDK
jgi:hypothetical protein